MLRVVGLRGVGDVAAALRSGLSAVEPGALIRRAVKRRGGHLHIAGHLVELRRFHDFVIVGGGKAAEGMAAEMLRLLNGLDVRGVVVVPRGYRLRRRLTPLEVLQASHPLPDSSSEEAGKRILETVSSCSRDSLVFVLVSGGFSALAAVPAEGVSLQDKLETTSALLRAGASIDELNTVRKHLSAFKGGWLAKNLRCRAFTLILSDVVGDRVDVIGSGPTAPDPTTYQDALDVLRKHGVKVPENVWRRLRLGAEGVYSETPKPGDPCFRRVVNVVVGGCIDAVKAAAAEMRRRGYRVVALTSGVVGEARNVANIFAAVAHDVVKHGIPHPPPFALVAGGETTVTVRGPGRGGRNQELVLATLHLLRDVPRFVFASLGTDGVDGVTDAAGAAATHQSLRNAAQKGLAPIHYLENNDSYTFFSKAGGLIITGPTGTNVGDLMILAIR